MTIFVEKSVNSLKHEAAILRNQNDEFAKGAVWAIEWVLGVQVEPSAPYTNGFENANIHNTLADCEG